MANDKTWPRDLWLEAIWEDESLKPNERCVAYVYARYAGKGWETWCSWAELRRRTGIASKNGVWLALGRLKAAGYLVEIVPPRQHRSAVYRLASPVDNSLRGPLGEPLDDDPKSDPTRETDSRGPRNDSRGPRNDNQRSPEWEPSTQIENSEERSESASASRSRATTTKRSAVTIAEATLRRAHGVAAKIITEDTGIERETALSLVAKIAETRKPRDLVAYVRHLADSLALEPLLADLDFDGWVSDE